MADDTATEQKPQHTVLNSKFPVYLPAIKALHLPNDASFWDWVKIEIAVQATQDDAGKDWPVRPYRAVYDRVGRDVNSSDPANTTSDSATTDLSTSPDVEHPQADGQSHEPKSAFMDALLDESRKADEPDWKYEEKMQTENGDVAFRTTKSILVDLFYELEESISSNRLDELLHLSWEEDALSTLTIMFNSRSIHLGKSSRFTSYRCFGWLFEHHPQTLLVNLAWLVRPTFEKKVMADKGARDDGKIEDKTGSKGNEGEDDLVLVEGYDVMAKVQEMRDDDSIKYDVKHGVSHGYWKDLLNILVLAANDKLTVHCNPADILDQQKGMNDRCAKHKREWNQEKARQTRHDVQNERHDRVVKKFEDKSCAAYRALHIAVARLFASQLQRDRALLNSGTKAELKQLSLAAKWAPSFGEFHDKHTFIVSTIAEALYPNQSELCPDVPMDDRTMYLRHAREAYRKGTVSPLRKALAVVERNIAAKAFDMIQYERVPSLAMERYQELFMRKDGQRFSSYVDRVVEGKSRISGAVLLPSTLVAKCCKDGNGGLKARRSHGSSVALVKQKVMDGQWKSLVQRIRDSGSLQSSIAVCDVSGSMDSPIFRDGTAPIHSSMGLSLLLSEVVKEPFGGAVITFSESPYVVRVGGQADKRSLCDKIKALRLGVGYNTDFVAVFEDLILPLAIEHKLKQEDMVKQVFVFSDMQFDEASNHDGRWTSSFERIRKKYQTAGYELPRLIFWNLAGGRAGFGNADIAAGDSTAPKPVTVEEKGVALVSGYSQAMMKIFLDGGQLKDVENDEEVVDADLDGGEEGLVAVTKTKNTKMDPLSTVKKAISHKAYSMLSVVD